MMIRRELLVGATAFVLAPDAWAQLIAPPPGGQAPRSRPPLWGPPYTQNEMEDAQRRFGIRFPPDLFDFLLQRRFGRSPDWTSDEAGIRELLDWPLQGILIDIERNDFWAPFWGPRPASLSERLATATRLVNAAPKLIPLSGEFYIPETPFERGNPIFSVFLSDVNYRAANLADFVERLSARRLLGRVVGPKKPIPFWTELSQVQAQPPQPQPPAQAPAEPVTPAERG